MPTPAASLGLPTPFAYSAMRVLVMAPSEGDSAAIVHVLDAGGFSAHACRDIGEVSQVIEAGDFSGVGAVVIAHEALLPEDAGEIHRLGGTLARQPNWSDLPVILLASASGGEDVAWQIACRLDPVGNVTILERPLRRTTLLNAVTVALRARKRQYERRATLAELAAHRERLEELVEKRTAELAASTAGLMAAERLASLGTLAAGLGHDIANLALPIRTRLEALRETCSDPEAQGDLDAIKHSLTHLSNLSAGMRLMALDPTREESTGPALDLAAWAAEAIPILKAAVPRHVRLECRIDRGLGVLVPRHRLVQAVFNLVQNAGEAMAGQTSGEVRITASAEPVPSRFLSLVVSDNGPGMPAAILARCFEPYFSTKGRAISTGMGLGLVKGIVETAGGCVSVDSVPGQGTTFRLVLPRVMSNPNSGTPGRKLQGAVSVANARTAAIASMLMDQLGIEAVVHGGPGSPSTDVWLLDTPDSLRITEYLGDDPKHQVVLLGEPGKQANCRGSNGSSGDRRLVVVRQSPAPSELRDALASRLAGIEGR